MVCRTRSFTMICSAVNRFRANSLPPSSTENPNIQLGLVLGGMVKPAIGLSQASNFWSVLRDDGRIGLLTDRHQGVGCGKGRNDTLSVEGPLFVVPRSFLHEAFPTNTSLSWRAAMRPHDPSFHGRDSRKSIRYLFTINCTCGNVFETARTSLMSLIGYARVSSAEGRHRHLLEHRPAGRSGR